MFSFAAFGKALLLRACLAVVFVDDLARFIFVFDCYA